MWKPSNTDSMQTFHIINYKLMAEINYYVCFKAIDTTLLVYNINYALYHIQRELNCKTMGKKTFLEPIHYIRSITLFVLGQNIFNII